MIDGRPGVTFGFHLCRGNQGSRWLVAGGYDADRARGCSAESSAQRLLLEYDDERSGSFEPLRRGARRQGGGAGPGDDEVRRAARRWRSWSARIREAAAYIDLERLAISPQCGFATSVVGNALTQDDERAKLETIARAAAAIWG